jgi:hypothetical protein
MRSDALKRISLLWRRFTPLELGLLDAVRSVLPRAALPIFDAQVNAVTRVQRLPGWSEIAFYRMRHGRVSWDGVPLFPATSELPLAEVRFAVRGRSFRAILTAIHGHIFDFAITPGARDIAFDSWDCEPRVHLLADPLNDMETPAHVALPEPWLSFLRDAGPGDAHGWVLYTESEAYRVALEAGEFLVLAERPGERFLLYRLHPQPGAFFVQDGDDLPVQPLRTRLDELLRAPVDPTA